MPFTPETSKVIFQKIKTIMLRHSPPMVITKDDKVNFELIGNKLVPYGAKKEIIPGMYFSSSVVRKSMISFYFFPLYFNLSEFESLIPTMKKCLKGKTCFHIKNLSEFNEKELESLFKKGVKVWEKNGFMQ